RKSFEVALHAGTAAALLLALRAEVGEAVTGFDARTAGLIAGSFVPPAIVGRAFERRLGGPGSIAAGLAMGSLAMVVADRRGASARSREDAGLADALWLGV